MTGIKNIARSAFDKAFSHFGENKAKYVGAATAVVTSVNAFMLQAGAEGETVDVGSQLVTAMSGVDYNIVLTTVVALIPVVFPAVFNLTAIRKGISWVLSLMRGA